MIKAILHLSANVDKGLRQTIIDYPPLIVRMNKKIREVVRGSLPYSIP